MNYRINEEKTFIDYADGEMIALLLETGTYYTFSDAAGALISDLLAGCSLEQAADALISASNNTLTQDKVEAFVSGLEEAGILEKAAESHGDAECQAVNCKKITSDFALEMEMFTDVADYFMVDPIHEVNPDMGWPVAKPNE